MRYLLQVRGFWRNVWYANEAENPAKVLSDVMGFLADKTLVPDSGEWPWQCASLAECAMAPLLWRNGGSNCPL